MIVGLSRKLDSARGANEAYMSTSIFTSDVSAFCTSVESCHGFICRSNLQLHVVRNTVPAFFAVNLGSWHMIQIVESILKCFGVLHCVSCS